MGMVVGRVRNPTVPRHAAGFCLAAFALHILAYSRIAVQVARPVSGGGLAFFLFPALGFAPRSGAKNTKINKKTPSRVGAVTILGGVPQYRERVFSCK